ncbi:hypothetical protein [Intrasporangium sp. YIM S08009]|uniref:hypothetical protein n=1 Tax=Intrasporangium zincisolvens TaxID=3080018 RepID=UPI002B06028D|nr:hypothetical protein [Intrasporangium sp. YIM S08009]
MQTLQILAAWHQIYLTPFDASPQFVGDGLGTLVAAASEPAHLIVRTGCATGPVRVNLMALLGPPEGALEPARDEPEPWEALEEISVPITVPLFWSSPDPGLDLPRDPAFIPKLPGPHRVRVSARGRNRAFDLAIDEPVEDYLVQLWPERTMREPEVLRSDRAPY